MSADAVALISLAQRLQAQGRFAEAATAYRQVLALTTELPDCWYNLALCLRQLGRFDEALLCYEAALRRGASVPEEIHLNRAVIYADHLQNSAAALTELTHALQLQPDYVPALLNLANLREDLGERAAAMQLYEHVLRVVPDHVLALSRLLGLSRIDSAANPLIRALRPLLRDGGRTLEERADAGFALGRALDSCGEYTEAFGAYQVANECVREQGRGVFAPYDRSSEERFFGEIARTFAHIAPAGEAAGADAGPQPIFICGMFRSGSTLVERMLTQRLGLVAGGELNLLPRLVQTYFAPFPTGASGLSAERFQRLASDYRASLHGLFPGATRVTDKRPDNFLYLGIIRQAFPRARIIHTVRNPLDNCLSIYFLHLHPGMTYATDLLDIGHHYGLYRQLMQHWQSLYPHDILDVDYDELVRAPEAVLGRLESFVGTGDTSTPAADRTHRDAPQTVKTASVWQVREPLYQKSSGRSRHYASQLEPLSRYLDSRGICLLPQRLSRPPQPGC